MLWRTALCLLLSLTLSACSDGGDDTPAGAEPRSTEAYVADPTEDQKEVMYAGRTAVIDYNFDDMGLAIFSRLENRTGDITDDVDVVLLSPKTLGSDFAINEAVQLVKLYERGGTIIMIEPQNENWQKLGALLKKAEEQMAEDATMDIDIHRLVDRWEMLQVQNGGAGGFGKADAVALRLDDTYIISDLQEQTDSCYIAAGETPQEVTPYRYGKSADLLMEWLKKGTENQARLAAGRKEAVALSRASSDASSLTEIARAQMVTVQKTVGPSRVLGKSMPYEFMYQIYSAYSFDKDEEYYIIRQNINFHASRLACTENDDEKWTKVDPKKTVKLDQKGKTKTVKWVFGPYMRKSIVKSTLVNLAGSETVHLVDPLPATTTVETSFTTGFKWSVSGIIAFNPTHPYVPDGGVSASVEWSDQYTTRASQLQITQDYGNVYTQWTLDGLKPNTYRTWYYPNTWDWPDHTKVADFQYNDWSTDLTWTFRIEHPDKARTYRLAVNDYTEIAELLYDSSDLELAVHLWQYHEIDLTPPNRYMQKWMLMCTNQRLQENIRAQFPDIWGDTYTTAALTKEGLEENMVIGFNRIKNAIKGYAPTLVKQGYTGRYTFSVSKEGSTEDFMTFTLDNGVVE